MENRIQEVFTNAKDGVLYINIYSKGKTALGRDLSHFAHSPFEHPTFGKFNCMEGFWHYVGGIPRDERLRKAPGWIAKKIGKTLEKKFNPNFQQWIKEGNRAKIESDPALKKAFTESELPFVHYYIDDNGFVTLPSAHDWLIPQFEELRNDFRVEAGLDVLPKSPYI